jgi:hypothetical protein
MLEAIGGQVGGPKASQAISSHWVELNRLIKKHCNKQYSSEIDSFSPLLRVDGELHEWTWNQEGCTKLRLARKKKYITADIGVLRKHWENQSANSIRRYLIENLEECLKLMVARLKKEKIDVDETQLFADFELVRSAYVNV